MKSKLTMTINAIETLAKITIGILFTAICFIGIGFIARSVALLIRIGWGALLLLLLAAPAVGQTVMTAELRPEPLQTNYVGTPLPGVLIHDLLWRVPKRNFMCNDRYVLGKQWSLDEWCSVHKVEGDGEEVIRKFWDWCNAQPEVIRTEWRMETNRVDTARTSAIRAPSQFVYAVYLPDTIHYTETVYSNLCAIVRYAGKEFPVTLDKRIASVSHLTRPDGPLFNPVTLENLGSTMNAVVVPGNGVLVLTNDGHSLTITNTGTTKVITYPTNGLSVN